MRRGKRLQFHIFMNSHKRVLKIGTKCEKGIQLPGACTENNSMKYSFLFHTFEQFL